MAQHETKCAAAAGPAGPCDQVVGWATFDAYVDPTGVIPGALEPLRVAGWECVLGSWFCPAHKDAGARLVVTRVRERAAATSPRGGK